MKNGIEALLSKLSELQREINQRNETPEKFNIVSQSNQKKVSIIK